MKKNLKNILGEYFFGTETKRTITNLRNIARETCQEEHCTPEYIKNHIMMNHNEEHFLFFGKFVPNMCGISSLVGITLLESRLEMENLERILYYGILLIPLIYGEYKRKKHSEASKLFVETYKREYTRTISEFKKDDEGEEWKYNLK